MTRPALLTPAKVAEMLGVSPITVRSWVTKGWLKSVTTPGGHRRFLQADLEKFIRERSGSNKTEPKHPKILIVDDDEYFREYLFEAIHLIDPEMEIQQASDGFHAGMIMSTLMPDIIFLDYEMPGLNGDEVCRQIKANPLHAGTHVIGITGHTDKETEIRLINAGMDQVLFKPFDINQLKAALAV